MEASYLLPEVLGSGQREERTVRELLGGFEGLGGAAGSITGFRRSQVTPGGREDSKEVIRSVQRGRRSVRKLLVGFEGLRGAAGPITGFRRDVRSSQRARDQPE